MTKIKTLAIILVVAMMLMGAGYAIFTDEVIIAGTVETGNMNIIIEDVDVKSAGVEVDEDELKRNNEDAKINLTKLVPDGYAEITFIFKNEGNIDAIVKEIIIEKDLGDLESYLIIPKESIIGDESIIDDELIVGETIEANKTLEWTLRIELKDVATGGINNIQGESGELTIKPQFIQAFRQEKGR